MAKVLLFNISDKDYSLKVRLVLVRLGIKYTDVPAGDFGQSIGFLCGAEGFEATPEAEGTVSGQMLVMYGLSSSQMDGLLAGLRSQALPQILKAAVTDTNISWSAEKLYTEISAEHEAMKGLSMKNAKRSSVHKKKK